LYKGKLILAYGVPPLLRLWRERGNSAIRRVDNQRCAPTHMLVGQKNRCAICTAHILFAPPIGSPLVGANDAGSFLIQLGPLLICEKRLVSEPGRSL
jgi:hypothetical protein